MYHDGLLSGRYDEQDDNVGQYTPEVYHPDIALFWHSIGGAIVGTICLVSTIWYQNFWLFRFGIVIAGLASYLFFLWLGIIIAKMIWPSAVKKEIIRKTILKPGESDPDTWIFSLVPCTIFSLILAYSWNWQFSHIGILAILSAVILVVLIYIAFDRINYVFND